MSDVDRTVGLVRHTVDRLIALGVPHDDAVAIVTLACQALLVADAAPRLAKLGLSSAFFDALSVLHQEVFDANVEVDRG